MGREDPCCGGPRSKLHTSAGSEWGAGGANKRRRAKPGAVVANLFKQEPLCQTSHAQSLTSHSSVLKLAVGCSRNGFGSSGARG